jgi:hypothetical protein
MHVNVRCNLDLLHSSTLSTFNHMHASKRPPPPLRLPD